MFKKSLEHTCNELNIAKRYWNATKSFDIDSTPKTHVTPNKGASTQILLTPDLKKTKKSSLLLLFNKQYVKCLRNVFKRNVRNQQN